MHTTFTLSIDDLTAAYRFHNIGRYRQRRTWIRFLAVFLVLSAMLIIADRGQNPGDIAIGVCLIFGYLAAWIAGLFAFNYWFYLPRMARRVYAQTRNLQVSCDAEWSDEGIRFVSAHSTVAYAWPDFFAMKRNAEMLLLYQSELMFHVLPMRALTAEQAQDIVARVMNAKSAQA